MSTRANSDSLERALAYLRDGDRSVALFHDHNRPRIVFDCQKENARATMTEKEILFR
jgi:hypothetical protein